MNSIKPDISIIVPLLNEADQLPELLDSLVKQIGVTVELLLCDGGSKDGSQNVTIAAATDCHFPIKLIQTERGRGTQMNAGAAIAMADLLLFLHADSRFEECNALLEAVTYYRRTTNSTAESFAARFGLKFRRCGVGRALAYFYYEAKARLPRRDCIRGDQGFLLSRTAFHEVGGFDQSLPFLEDLRLVAATAPQIQWRLLPVTISTSARRFEQEGLLERQILNAIIVNNLQAGWNEFFESLPGLYHRHGHDSSKKLRLLPILEEINRLLKQSPAEWRRSFWLATGRHVAANAWQLFYWLDARRTFRAGSTSAEVQPQCFCIYQRRLKPFFESRLATFLAQIVVRLWLSWMLFMPKGSSSGD